MLRSTDGPWEVGGVSTVRIDEDEKVVMVICQEGERTPVLAWVPVCDDRKKCVADARLMAMAPKMLSLFREIAVMPDTPLSASTIKWFARWVVDTMDFEEEVV